MSYPIHDLETAPAASKDVLAAAQKGFGFIPNLLGAMAEAPALLKAYTTLSRIFEETSFSASERQVVLLATSHENGCAYCVAAHGVIATMQKVPGDVTEAMCDHRPIADPRLEALRGFTTAVVASRGWPSEADLAAFTAAGYQHQQVLEVLLGVGLKTLSNYTNHICETPLDRAFAEAARSATA